MWLSPSGRSHTKGKKGILGLLLATGKRKRKKISKKLARKLLAKKRLKKRLLINNAISIHRKMHARNLELARELEDYKIAYKFLAQTPSESYLQKILHTREKLHQAKRHSQTNWQDFLHKKTDKENNYTDNHYTKDQDTDNEV